ncbi:MAG TPA: DUF2461 domain-containing protein [Gemmatimonadales bacterium]|nr:DUF2461 domain-containing protein [Gemmatimonadales bacterium]
MAFTSATLVFFRGLARNNKKPWFEAHRAAYEQDVVAPMRELIEEIDVRLARFAPEIMGHPKRSMFRIYRDVRFSKDKSPYKTNAGCWFWHRDADPRVGDSAEGGGAGFYFHLQPGNSFTGAGIWMPPRPLLGKLRDAIVADPRGFERIVKHPGFVRRFGGLDEEHCLKRMPRGYDEQHPAARWLKFQSFVSGRDLSDNQITSPRLAALLQDDFAKLLPLVRWLNGALGLKAAESR